ncbi:hypothetical protein F6X40_41220 [Paraburkholderia sp. UCT31]|uniref:hypothetical protein n=1 Tax=Paraburkholderia sp. UCT31 TaxID=2615209 RepID=UPI001655EBD9|nr:hypothetical protein [Paraburkholderia sp. UCT31]MBC8742887.1 hypothetical protein [Paraburkholderia sp. UCT31]
MEDQEQECRADIAAFRALLAGKAPLRTEGDAMFHAFVYAEQDRQAYLDASGYRRDKPQERYLVEIAEALAQAKALRLKVWGETALEVTRRTGTAVPVQQVAANAATASREVARGAAQCPSTPASNVA